MKTTTDVSRLLSSLAGLCLAWFCLIAATDRADAAADLYMKDTPADSGIEPNPDGGPMWISEDIWVRTTPDPGYQPYPFPEGSPPWVPLPHVNPEYRDPKYSVPNYVYVRVRNRGSTASSGTERLRAYWAKASTGLSWPSQWEDYMAANCGPLKLYGMEITKARKNAATATAAERNAYRDAVVAIGTAAPYVFPGGVRFFDKQDEVHENAPGVAHSSPGFTPWHREMMNRYEVLLQEHNPLVKLLYWDWTTDPENSTGGFNLFTASFMGISGRGTGGVPIGAPFNVLFPPIISRNLSPSTTPPAVSDLTVLAPADYSSFRSTLEGSAHNGSHGYIGGGGNMSFLNAAAEDPFFFLLHGNVDRLWAQWQRNPASLGRLDPATAYGLDGGLSSINNVMSPWDGTAAIRPWTVGDGYIISKSPKSPSLVTAPVYDVAPLRIPVLQPGEAVVLQIPWYPPNPADFACFGGDQGHVCLLARIETATSSPFGMTFLETADVNLNTKNNNNIVWKNITVVDNFPGALQFATILIRNTHPKAILGGIRFQQPDDFGPSFLDFGRLVVDLKPELFKRWRAAGGAAQGVEVVGENQVQFFSPRAFLQGIPLQPGETFTVDIRFELNKNYQPLRGQRINLDLIQTGTLEDPNGVAGGQRFQIDFNQLVFVKRGSDWRYSDAGKLPGADWFAPNFDDQKWPSGKAELGFGNNPVTRLRDNGSVATYFRHSFNLTDPGLVRSLVLRLKRDDGAVVYLNGHEVHRVLLPEGRVTAQTYATAAVNGLAEDIFWPTDLSNFIPLLQQGPNVVAVEIHQAPAKPGVPSSGPDDDVGFDLELAANQEDLGVPPSVAFVSPADGAYFQQGFPIVLRAEAIDVDGKVRGVSFFADDELLSVDTDPPYEFTWQQAGPGRHRLRAVALDDRQSTQTAFASVVVLKNLPPLVEMAFPLDGAVVDSGIGISAEALASDVGGKVASVEFLLRRGHQFTDPFLSVGIVKADPFQLFLPPLQVGHYAIQARATDDAGQASLSSPVHFEVSRAGELRLHIMPMNGMVMLMWETQGVLLEQAPTVTGPWGVVPNAQSGIMLPPSARASFYRLRTQ